MSRRRAATARVRRLTVPLALSALLLAAGCTAPEPLVKPSEALAATDGLVVSAGYGDRGQLGRASATGIRTALGPVLDRDGQELDGVVALAAGEEHSLALRRDGQVLAWGANEDGQLGDGSRNPSLSPVLVRSAGGGPEPLGSVVAIAADSNTSMALLADGTVAVWGRMNSGQRGNHDTASDPLVPSLVLTPDGTAPLRGIEAISVDGGTEFALTADGQVLGWGDNTFGQLGTRAPKVASLPVLVRGAGGKPLQDVRQVSAGGQHAVALLADGRVLAWGRNDTGQLGDGSSADRNEPREVRGPSGGVLDDVVQVSAAEKYTLATREDGTAVGWGQNTRGQLGDGSRESRRSAVRVAGVGKHGTLRGITQVFAGESYSAAILDDGQLLTWGANGRGQLASGDREDRTAPGPVAFEPASPTPNTAVTVGTGRRHILVALQ